MTANDARLTGLLQQVGAGEISVETALEQLRDLPYQDLGFARVDHHRALRTGFPEVIFCPGKEHDQILAIADRLAAYSSKVLATRATPDVAEAIQRRFPNAKYHPVARMAVIPGQYFEAEPKPKLDKTALVVCAGTADIPVAEEAAVTLEELGSPVERLWDVGVAGLHRLLDAREKLFAANVLVVVAGMEGALASVVAGMVSQPVIAVPTSVGYGASFQGLAALLAMLNSCAVGVVTVNIDNGFGAGYFAHLINR